MSDSEQNDLKQLRSQRGKVRGKLTRAKHFYEKIQLSQIDDSIYNQLLLRAKSIVPLLEEFNSIQDDIENDDSCDEESEEREEFENVYFEVLANFNDTISKFSKQSQGIVDASSSRSKTDSTHSDNNSINNSQLQQVTLPTIKLPIFRGIYADWLEFRDAFMSLVHNNKTISDVAKFYHLRSSLEGDAGQLIQSLEATDANYKIAWDLLVERYENKRLIIYNHVKAIFDQPVLGKESHTDLRSLYDNVTRHLRCLKILEQPVQSWDTLLIHLLIGKLDNNSRREWESYKINDSLPTMADLNSFLKQRCELLEKLHVTRIEKKVDRFDNSYSKSSSAYSGKFKDKGKTSAYVSTGQLSCYYCKNAHTIYKCEQFLKLTHSEKVQEISRLNLCHNCLRPSHTTDQCRLSSCKKCKLRHNTMLHVDYKETPTTTVSSNNTLPGGSIEQKTVVGLANYSATTILSTVLIAVRDTENKVYNIRGILDSGAMSSFITERIAHQLKLPLRKTNYSIIGVGQTKTNIQYITDLRIYSRTTGFNAVVTCLVLPQITENLPTVSFDKYNLNIPRNLEWQLADPDFNESGPIDILLGSNIFWQLLGTNQYKLSHSSLMLQETRLGWVVAGNVGAFNGQSISVSCFQRQIDNNALDKTISRFWQIEEVNSQQVLSQSEQFCESHFVETLIRAEDGKFVVSIPFRDNVQQLGNSRDLALERFHSLERKLVKNPDLYREYKKVMNEYQSMDHMVEVTDSDICDELNYYMPHHSVVKLTSTTTPYRVVFDASMKTDSGLSLNDVQYSGPVIQNDLFSILLRFRSYNYVMTADISKMYRMIYVQENQRQFQRVFWRSDPSEEIKCFEMTRVVFGTASAPFLAVRCLYQLGLEAEETYPLASETIKNDFYVDDCITGCNTEQELLQLQYELTSILSNAGFELRKWLSNKKELCQSFQVNDNLDASILQIGENDSNKTLGVLWNASLDTIQYAINKSTYNTVITKRQVLSITSQIFDPLGLLGPIIIVAKLFIQKLWQEKIGWDTPISQNLFTAWKLFERDLSLLNEIKIIRKAIIKDYVSIELHGFSDSSEAAYGACIYIRCRDKDGIFFTRLLCAKSRVAPIKKVTIPRLELCGALLLAQLQDKVKRSINREFDRVYLWSDSTITLAWIKGCPSKWKTFVANRVCEIQRLTNQDDWNHVNSQDNPADLISRGTTATVLTNSQLWWSGPDWLKNDNFKLSNNQFKLEEIPECRSINCVSNTVNNFNIFERFSSLARLQRVFAYCLRFIYNTRQSINNKRQGILTPSELHESLYTLIRIVQRETFSQEYNCLLNKKPISSKSNLLSLTPFLDKNNLLRVGGRIQNSNEAFDKKHQIILPAKHLLTKSIFLQEHEKLLHCGPTMLLSSIRERFWPISGRNLAKGVIRQCVTCFRVNPRSEQYLMGNLPEFRVNQYLPFYNTGVDYAGPFLVKDRNTRGAKLTKAYVCLFICFSTKAVHLELVSDLTTACFLAALKRFVGRRGKPSNIFSDNAKNFVGANIELSRFFDSESDTIYKSLSNDNITWQFIPARSPNFGGLWEAGIKSAKYHLKRILGNAHLNFEQFLTMLVQVESILNSRPLCPLTSSPDQLVPLTPAHFLVGRSLTAIPESSFLHVPENKLKHYQRVQQLVQHFWARWHTEYLTELQTRVKWKTNANNFIHEGTIVLVKEDNVPALKWHMGRVLKLYPGKDNVTRVASVKVNGSVVKRAISRLCVFPFQNTEGNSNNNYN